MMTDSVTGGRDVWWRTQLTGVTRNRCNTVFANVIETSNVKCTTKTIRWPQHKEESLAVFQYVDCHSADNVLKTIFGIHIPQT